jgi:hypothetical protein
MQRLHCRRGASGTVLAWRRQPHAGIVKWGAAFSEPDLIAQTNLRHVGVIHLFFQPGPNKRQECSFYLAVDVFVVI